MKLAHSIRWAIPLALVLAAAAASAQPAPPLVAAPGAIDVKTLSPADLHAVCVKALNADPKLAAQVVDAVNEDTKQQHLDAAEHVAKNERHVILAYAAMWIISALFVLFLWRRQQLLRGEIDRLRRDLAEATAGDQQA
jgi:hypothetical protein